ncbi:MAG: hypothetical protein Q8R53_04725 [Nanoarchaeota archaeon]|nr:hypothetical protein [Nanoarchaeota archaeon]
MDKKSTDELKIGVVGYSWQNFDEEEAIRLLREAYDTLERQYPQEKKAVISGLTDIGIPALAYREAVSRQWRTIGIACSKAKQYTCFPVAEEILIGDDWGDESATFLDSIDVLVKVGGGKQAIAEMNAFRETGKPVREYQLPRRI